MYRFPPPFKLPSCDIFNVLNATSNLNFPIYMPLLFSECKALHCMHRCEVDKNDQMRCGCNEGYRLQSDNMTCAVGWYQYNIRE